MPFKSQDQRGYMWIHHPKIAKRWEKITDDKSLPKKASASDNAAFDTHQTDPRRLKAEVEKDLNIAPQVELPKAGDVRLVWDPRNGERSAIKVKSVRHDHFIGIDHGGEAVSAVWDNQRKTWKRYGRIGI